MISKKLKIFLLIWPSFGILSGSGLGALPVGAIFLLRYVKSFLSYRLIFFGFWLLGCIFYFINPETKNIKDLVGLVSMPFIFILTEKFFKKSFTNLSDLQKFDKVLIYFCFVLLLDAFLGASVFGLSGLRSHTFLTLEPSHSARFFYTIIFFMTVTGRSTALIISL